MYRYFVHSQNYSFLSVTLTCILGWLQHRLNDGDIEIQIYLSCKVIQPSVIISRHQTSIMSFSYLVTQETQSNLSCYSIQVKSCLHQRNYNLFFIPPQERSHFPLPRGKLSSLHLMSTLPHFPYFPRAKASFHKSNISVSFKLREKIRVIGIYSYMKFLCIIQKWRVHHMFGSYFDQ